MGSTKKETISGFNEYIETLKKEDNSSLLRFSLTKFNSNSWIVYTDKELADVPTLDETNFVPNGMTALLDAVGKSVNALDSKHSHATQDDRYLIIILTDGGENSSREFDTQAIRRLLEGKREENWTFVFLGADESAWGVASDLGISRGNTSYFGVSKQARGTTMSNLATASTGFTSGSSASTLNIYQDSAIDNTIDPDAKPWVPGEPSPKKKEKTPPKK